MRICGAPARRGIAVLEPEDLPQRGLGGEERSTDPRYAPCSRSSPSGRTATPARVASQSTARGAEPILPARRTYQDTGGALRQYTLSAGRDSLWLLSNRPHLPRYAYFASAITFGATTSTVFSTTVSAKRRTTVSMLM